MAGAAVGYDVNHVILWTLIWFIKKANGKRLTEGPASGPDEDTSVFIPV